MTFRSVAAAAALCCCATPVLAQSGMSHGHRSGSNMSSGNMPRVELLALQQQLRDDGCGLQHVTGSMNSQTRRAIATCEKKYGVADVQALVDTMHIGFGANMAMPSLSEARAGAMNNGSMTNGSMTNGSMTNGSMNNGAMNNGAMNGGMRRGRRGMRAGMGADSTGMMNHGGMNNGGMNHGAMGDSMMMRRDSMGMRRGMRRGMRGHNGGMNNGMGADSTHAHMDSAGRPTTTP